LSRNQAELELARLEFGRGPGAPLRRTPSRSRTTTRARAPSPCRRRRSGSQGGGGHREAEPRLLLHPLRPSTGAPASGWWTWARGQPRPRDRASGDPAAGPDVRGLQHPREGSHLRAARDRGRQARAEVRLPDEPDSPREGTLTFLDNAVQDGTGTVKLRATVANADWRFWPGRFVKVRLVLGTRRAPSWSLPARRRPRRRAPSSTS